jgi:small-conductance mechanosensitive channel
MQNLKDWWTSFEHSAYFVPLVRAVFLLTVGLPLVRIGGYLVGRTLRRHASEQTAMVLRKTLIYGATALLLVMALSEFGFKLQSLLGAAGIAGIAVGFAAQTTLSNLISGVFLLWERSFLVGDVVSVGDNTGIVDSVNLLSVRLRTFDNRLVRIPNENLIKAPMINITRFPIRRFDVDVGVAYRSDPDQVMRILREVADGNPLCLDEPRPVVLFKGFGDSALQFMLGVWFAKQDFLAVRNSVLRDIKVRFAAEGIEIPFPQRTLTVAPDSAPLAVQVVGETAHAVPTGGTAGGAGGSGPDPAARG